MKCVAKEKTLQIISPIVFFFIIVIIIIIILNSSIIRTLQAGFDFFP